MDKKLVALMSIFMLSFGLFIIITIFNKPLSRLTKAKEEFVPSSEASLIFAWPLTAKADGEYTVSVNVFIRNTSNVPLANKQVKITSSLGLVKDIIPTTDKSGKATFALGSSSPGIAELTTTVDNQVNLKQKISVKFE